MKHLLFTFLLLAALFPNCKKEQMIIQTPVPLDTVSHIIGLGQGSVLKNGTLWNATFVSYYYGLGDKSKFQIRMGTNPGGDLSEFFYITDIPGQLGKYTVKFTQTSLTLITGFQMQYLVYPTMTQA